MIAGGKTIASVFDADGHHGPSFDIIRLFAAIVVIFSHSFTITGNVAWAWVAVTRQLSMGGVAVAVFFILSGYVNTESFRRNPVALSFLRKRALRIYPALATVVLLTALVYGPAMTRLSLGQYFSSPGTILYLVSMVFPVREALPGVFDHAPTYLVNGSLWTLRYEMICYILIALFGTAMLGRRYLVLGLAFAFALVSAALAADHLFPTGFALFQVTRGLPLFACFAGGVCMSLFAGQIPVRTDLIVVAALLVVLSLVFAGFYLVFPFAGAYLIVVLGNSGILAFPKLRRGIFAGDFSYGTYIIAFPVEQAVRQIIGSGCTWWMVFLIATPITLCLAVLSWNLIEKPFLRFKYANSSLSLRPA